MRILSASVVGALCTGIMAGGIAACGGNSRISGSEQADSSTGGAGNANGAGPSFSSGGGGTFGGSGSSGSDAGGSPTATAAVQVIDDCKTGASLTSAQMQALLQGGSPGALRFLYPYAGTLFPRGLLPPTLMWDGGSADLIYLHIKSSGFEYKGCVAPTADGQFELPLTVWSAAESATKGGNDPFTVELSLLEGSKASGPISEQIFIAPATLKGTIYYNSYSSKLVNLSTVSSVTASLASLLGLDGGFGPGSGAVLRIRPGKAAEVFIGDHECTGCHAVSANGTRLVADAIVGSGGDTYALTPDMPPEPKALASGVQGATFVGVSPDGSLYVANGHPGGMGPRYAVIAGITNAALFETDTGKEVADAGVPTGAMCPTFSPDGAQLVFNDYAIGNGHGLATMTFDKVARKAGGYKKIFEESDTSVFPGWPFFLPDNKAVVFLLGAANDFSGSGVGIIGSSTTTAGAPSGDVYILDLASGKNVILAAAMGFASAQDVAAGKTYLPFGTEELHHQYYPTVSPVAAGGYFWIFFDSFRHYGNQGLQRQLWGAAVDLSSSGGYTTDGSHPAFYVTGQELGTGNHRAFTALDPCRADGADCTTGVDCCSGLCTNGKCGGPPRCSNIDEACGAGHDCCDPTIPCIGGFCAAPPPK
jgi:hypothetical protein